MEEEAVEVPPETTAAAEGEEARDRTQHTPFLLRLFVKENGRHSVHDFKGTAAEGHWRAADGEVRTYAWADTTLADLAARVPRDVPAFHVFRYSHEHDGAHLDSVVFVNSCPDGSGATKSEPVKSRMMYSSSKSGVEALIAAAGRQPDLKLEINDGDVDISEEIVRNKLHPPPVAKKAAFAKPKAGGRGPRRLTSRTTPQ